LDVSLFKLARIVPLVLIGFAGCSLELPGAGSEWEEEPDASGDVDAGGADAAGPALDAEPVQDAETDAFNAPPLDAALDAGPDASVDAGADAAAVPHCGSALLGAVEQRVRYAAVQVVAPASCASETQQRSCGASGWSSWSGTYQSEQCSVATYRSCGAVAHGAQEFRTRYVTALANSGAGCLSEQQTRTCNDGSFGAWSGSYQVVSCAIALSGTCALDSQVLCQQGTTCSAAQGQPPKCLGTPGFDCSANTQCVATCIDGECAAKAEPGAACDELADCAGCSSGSVVDCVDNTCRCGDGAECSANQQCKATCVDQTCAPANELCDDDADCRDGRECLRKSGVDACLLPEGSACSENASCERVCRESECSAPGTVSDSCDENADCSVFLVCRAQLCAQRGTLGQTCDESSDCGTGLSCGQLGLSDVCLKVAGQPCTLPLECASGRCTSSGSGSGSCQ
jgi:hypothetical protein